MIQLLLVDGDGFAAEVLREFLIGVPDFEITGSVTSGQEALVQLASQPLDVLLLGCPLPDMPGIQVITEILAHGWPTRILVIGTSEDLEQVLALGQTGAHGYFVRGDTQENMLAVVRAVAGGETWFSQKIATQLFTRLYAKEEERLTPRQIEILWLVEKGTTNKEIALALNCTEKNIEGVLGRIYRKLSASNRTQAVSVARDRGLFKGQ